LLCILLLVCELSAIEHIGLQVMFPVFAVGTGGEAGIYEEIIKRESGTFLPSYIYAQKSPVKDRRKDSFKLRIIEDGEMITLMELENISQEYDVIYMSDIDEAEDDTADLEDNSGILPEAFDNSTSDKQQDLGQFVKHERKVSIPLSDLKEYEDLVKRFYTIDAITTIGAGELNAEKLAGIDMTMKQTADSPQILIYHTHSQEGFVDSIPGDDMTTIMGVGEHLKEILEQEYGYNVIHHWGKYDVQARDSAYSKSLPAVKQLLE